MKAAVLVFVLAASSFAGTVYNNFTGDNPFWHPLGNPDTATYGEKFTAPTNGDNVLDSFSFYMGGPVSDHPGNILLRAYISPWNGSFAGTPLYTSDQVNYANTGFANLSFSPAGGISLVGGASYVAFLSVSGATEYGQSSGQSNISAGDTSIPGSGFVYFNNAGDFGRLFTDTWDATGLTPDWAITASFSGGQVPEPGTLALLGLGIAALAIRRKRAA